MEATNTRNLRKVRSGKVISDKMDKTLVVAVERLVRHRIYGRVIRRNKRIKVHDELNQGREGDFVEVMETRPLSKQKRWRLVRIVRSAK